MSCDGRDCHHYHRHIPAEFRVPNLCVGCSEPVHPGDLLCPTCRRQADEESETIWQEDNPPRFDTPSPPGFWGIRG